MPPWSFSTFTTRVCPRRAHSASTCRRGALRALSVTKPPSKRSVTGSAAAGSATMSTNGRMRATVMTTRLYGRLPGPARSAVSLPEPGTLPYTSSSSSRPRPRQRRGLRSSGWRRSMLFRGAGPAVMLVAVAGAPVMAAPKVAEAAKMAPVCEAALTALNQKIDPTSLPMKVLNDHTKVGPYLPDNPQKKLGGVKANTVLTGTVEYQDGADRRTAPYICIGTQ